MKIIENKKEMANTDRNPDPGLGQAQNCDRVKPVNGIPTLHTQIYILYNYKILLSYYDIGLSSYNGFKALTFYPQVSHDLFFQNIVHCTYFHIPIPYPCCIGNQILYSITR